MIKYILGTELWMHPNLAKSMFRDRAEQFSKRLNWKVDVDRNGFERDQYDNLNPIYILIQNELGDHAGSMRLLPTTGRTMINEHFGMTLGSGPIRDPSTWECTRFCLSPNSDPMTAIKLFASAGRLMQEFQVSSLVAVFDRIMLRNYRLSGVSPELLGETGAGTTIVMAGRWRFNVEQLDILMNRAGLNLDEVELSLANSSLLNAHLKTYG